MENPEGAGEYVTVSPRRIGAPIPFEFSRVVLPVKGGTESFLVFAPEHTFAEDVDLERLVGEPTASAFSLDEAKKYFLVLVALCEPRLRDTATVALPTAGQVVERLRALPSCRSLNANAVNWHIDYLARKLRVKDDALGAASERLEWRREAAVSVALRFGPVRPDHLRLLPPRRPTTLA